MSTALGAHGPAYPSRVPAVPVALAVAVGIAIDRFVEVSFATWWLAAMSALCIAVVAMTLGRSRFLETLTLLVVFVLLGGARHHLAWSLRRPDDVARRVVDEPRFAVLEGTVAGSPWIRRRPEVSRTAWPEFDRTSFDLAVERIATDDGGTEPLSGLVRLSITGHLPNLRAGDRVEFSGWMAKPLPPTNPGEFDYPGWLRAKGVRTVGWANHPEAVRVVERGSEGNVVRAAARVQRSVEQLVDRRLDERVAPIAAALLVGSRSGIPDDTREAFAESGTLHLLAISGLHVGILAAFVWFACRIARFGVGPSTAVLLVVLVGYAVLTGGRPSVVRASIFVAVVVLGRPWHRRASSFQVLSLAAIGLLAWRPTDLFDVGAQLSFLAVTAIAFVAEWRRSLERPPTRIGDLVERGPVGRILVRSGNAVVAAWVVMTAIWLFSAPLVAATFHLISPAGLLLNIVLIPAVAVVMWCGYTFVLLGSLWGPSGEWFAGPFEFGLARLLDVTAWASQWSLGHRYVSGPAAWWTAGFHVGLLGLLFVVRRPAWRTRVAAALVAWTLFGTIVTPEPPSDRLRCTFLAVGHGNAVLVELPNGRSLLYDGGSLSAPEYAARVLRGAVWSSGRSRIDAVVVSHADVDHFNALVDLFDGVPVGTLFLAQPFLDFEQGFTAELCDAAVARGTSITLVHAGDTIPLDDDVSIRVLHPSAGTEYEGDNEASVVLMIEYAGRRILLTGDVEKGGLDELLATEATPVDVLASPHHGSRTANTPELAAWAAPRHVVVSAGSRANVDELAETYPDARTHWTHRDGAVVFEITSDGRFVE